MIIYSIYVIDPTNVWSARGLLIGEACVSLTLLLFTVVDHAFRFPSRPPRYPAPSSEQQAREQARRAALGVLPTVRVLLRGIGSILRNRDFLVIAVTTGAAQGSYSAWSSVSHAHFPSRQLLTLPYFLTTYALTTSS